MEGKKFLKPVDEDVLVRDPRSMVPLSNEGEWKPWLGKIGTYWRRRVRDKSVYVVNPDEKKVSNEILSEQSEKETSGKKSKIRRRS